MDQAVLHQIAEEEAFKINAITEVSGGSINAVYKLETSSDPMIIKLNPAEKYADMFKKEAKGLEILKGNGSFKVPAVYATGKLGDQAYLLMEYLPTSDDKSDTWQDFAVRLAQMHKQTADTFGLGHDNYIGSLPQYNQTDITNAGDFYIEKRLKPQFEQAKKVGFSFGNLNRFYEHLKYHIPNESPSLVHGDLWNGNYMLTADGIPALIDPAIAYAPREMDLGMMKLFGGFPEEAFAAYRDIAPLAEGWEDRIDIWQLYYLLVHLNLFGQNYFHPVTRIIARFK